MRTILAFTVLLALALAAPGSGQNGGQRPRENDRTVDIQAQPNQLQVTSKSRDPTSKSKLDFAVQTENGIKMRMDFAGIVNGTEVQTSLRVRLIALVEFDPATLDASANGVYSGGAFVKRLNFTRNTTVITTLSDTTIGNVTVKNFQFVNGPLIVILHLAGAPASRPNEAPITPGSLKFDINVSGYSFSAATNRLALLAMVDTSSPMRHRDRSTESLAGLSTNESEINIGGAAFFSFVNTAQCTDGPVINIGTSPLTIPAAGEDTDQTKLPGEKTQRVFFTFLADAPSAICWDPKIGADVADTGSTVDATTTPTPDASASSSSSSGFITASASLVVAALVALFAF